MKLSARNQLKGKIVEVTQGATTSHVRIDTGRGVIVTSSIGCRRPRPEEGRRSVGCHKSVGRDDRQITGRVAHFIVTSVTALVVPEGRLISPSGS